MEEDTKEELTNGLDEHTENVYDSATVSVQVQVAEVVGRPLETDEEKALFLTLLNTFFQSEMLQENLKMFVQFYMNEQQAPTEQKLVVPEKPKLIVP